MLPELYMIGYGGSIRAYSLNSSNSYKGNSWLSCSVLIIVGYPRDEDDFDYDELKSILRTDSVFPKSGTADFSLKPRDISLYIQPGTR